MEDASDTDQQVLVLSILDDIIKSMTDTGKTKHGIENETEKITYSWKTEHLKSVDKKFYLSLWIHKDILISGFIYLCLAYMYVSIVTANFSDFLATDW